MIPISLVFKESTLFQLPCHHLSLPASALCIGLLISGCAGEGKVDKNQLPTFPVSGVVQVDGKPVGPANLNLQPNEKNFPSAAASVGPDGRFTLMTYKKNDGAPKGKFTAKLSPNPGDQSPKFPAVETLEVEITKADSRLVLEFKGTGKDIVNPLAVPPVSRLNPNFSKGSPNAPQ